jgi:hypothetical protein
LFFTVKFFSEERFKGAKNVMHLIFQDVMGVLQVTVKFYKYQNMNGPHQKALWTTCDPWATSLAGPNLYYRWATILIGRPYYHLRVSYTDDIY